MDRDEALAETAVSPGSQRPGLDATEGDPAAAIAVASLTAKQIGRYRIERELGVGGMGIVYEVFDPDLERRVALKLILRATSEEGRARLLREARAMARLTHANIVRIYEIGSDQGREFVTMELVDGGSLADWLRAEPRSTREIVDAFIAAGRGLAAAHRAGIVHRDFKPHNVLRDTSGRIVVGDFGLATGLEMQASAAQITFAGYTTLTATGSWVGTPAYMAPEQWNGGSITPATDQFAFCIALWEALAGDRPFRGDDVEALRAAVTGGPAKLDASRIPRRFRALLRRGLDPDPAKRWPSMEAVIDQLARGRRRAVYWVSALLVLGIATGAVLVARSGPASERDEIRTRAATSADKIGEQVERQMNEALRRASDQAERAAGRPPRIERFEVPLPRDIPLPSTIIGIGSAEEDDDELDPDIDAETQIQLLKQVRRHSGNVELPRHAFVGLISELVLGKTTKLVPAMRDGKVQGLKVYEMTPGTFVDAIGLVNGDVLVAIDGVKLANPKLVPIGNLLRPEAGELKLELIRDGSPRTILVRVNAPQPPRPPQPPQ